MNLNSVQLVRALAQAREREEKLKVELLLTRERLEQAQQEIVRQHEGLRLFDYWRQRALAAQPEAKR